MASARSILGGLTAGFGLAVFGATAPVLAQSETSPQPAQQTAAETGAVVAFDIPAQPLSSALIQLSQQAGVQVVMEGERANNTTVSALRGEYTVGEALDLLLLDTGFTAARTGPLTYTVQGPADAAVAGQNTVGQRRPGIEEIIVTGQKREERIQDVPIAISAFTQEDLKVSQIAGGPDLHLQVPNMTFTKTNFTGYSIQIRGIGTQAISATTDPAVAVALNQTPFIRNRFFEQEFYDLERLEVLRGPQGTLFGRNATAGVVNLITAKPKFHYEAMGSLDVGNYNSRRWEGMVNLPLIDDKMALRIAGAGTKRDGYVFNEITGNPIDGRDLWSTRVSLRFAPTDRLDMNLIWERFEEEDDRLRSGKQLCHQDDRTHLHGLPKFGVRLGSSGQADWFSQGCIRASLYSQESFEAPDGFSLPYYYPLRGLNLPIPRDSFDPYLSKTQSRDLRVIESTVEPDYRAVSDIVQLQVNFDLTDSLTLTSESAYNDDEIFSLQDFNRFNTRPGAFLQPDEAEATFSNSYREGVLQPGPVGGIWCDPQLGCSDRVMGVDVSSAESRQFSQELRLSSNFEGPFNFSLGGNFLRYDTEDKYYVFINTLSMFTANNPGDILGNPPPPYTPDFDGRECMPQGHIHPDPLIGHSLGFSACYAMDPNPIGSLTDEGHNYFLSRNPYKLISYAAFGEAYYNVTDTLKLTAGLRWSVDKKEAPRIPSALLVPRTVGLTVEEVEKLEWREPTGRLVLDWQPNLGFTDETLLYGSYARGYKAGGSNPPVSIKTFWSGGDGANIVDAVIEKSITKPKTFDAEFVDAYEIGTKNTLADGAVTLNLAAFYYNYEGYQISEIVDRSAFNRNFDTEVWGAELEADWWVRENLRLGFKGGYQKTRIADGERAVDLMDRTAGGTHFRITDIPNPDFDPSQEIPVSEYVAGLVWDDIPDGQEFFAYDDWVVIRPFPTFTENCIVPLYVVAPFGTVRPPPGQLVNGTQGPCEYGYAQGLDPRTQQPYEPFSSGFYPGFDPATAPNNGEGFAKDLGGNELPNAPNYTSTLTADYIVPLTGDWIATLHTDVYWQSKSWWRVFNDHEYGRLDDYFTMNLAAIFINEQSGWDIMAYIKNVTDEDAITGAFLFSDDVGLTTNVFLVEPRLYGIRVTKEWGGGQGTQWLRRFDGLIGREPDRPSPWSLTLGGSLLRPNDAPYQPIPSPVETNEGFDPVRDQNLRLDAGEGGELTLTYRPAEGWRVSGGVRFGKARSDDRVDRRSAPHLGCTVGPPLEAYCSTETFQIRTSDWMVGNVANNEEHLLVDFEVGRDFGIGGDLESTVSAGIRYAGFQSRTHLDMESEPDWYVPEYGDPFNKYSDENARTHHFVDTDLTSRREFQGVGPSLTWDAAHRLWGDNETGRLDVDWSLSGAVLFGKQETSVSGEEQVAYYFQVGPQLNNVGTPVEPAEATVLPEDRSRSATVPMAGASLGLTYRAGGASIGAGYRWERYFGVVDGGFEEHKDYDRAIDGLYLKVTFGE